MKLRTMLAMSFVLLGSAGFHGVATAHEYKLGDLTIGHPWARPTVPGQPAAAAYISVENKGSASDRLTSIASTAAKTAEVHTMSMDGNIMRMRPVDAVEIKPAETVAMKPGKGYHLMLIGLAAPLKDGDRIPVTLNFEKAGKIDVMVNVEKPAASAAPETHKH